MLLEEAVPLKEAKGPRSRMFYGPGGSGKTYLAVHHPGKHLYLDMDERLHELVLPAEITNRVSVWKPDVTLGAPTVEVVKVDPTRKDVYKGTKISQEPKGYLRLVGVINELLGLYYKEKKIPYDCVTLDSLTRVTDHLEYLVMYQHGMTNMTETMYGVIKRNLKELITGFLRLPCDRILICHSKHVEKRDRDTNIVIQSYTRPNVTGTMAEELITYFSEVYYFLGRKGAEVKYEIQTATDREIAARTTRQLKFVNTADPKEIFS